MRTATEFFNRLSNIADHDFGKSFDQRFCKDELTDKEREWLLHSAQSHIEFMLLQRSFFEFKLKRHDKEDLKILKTLRTHKPLLAQIFTELEVKQLELS